MRLNTPTRRNRDRSLQIDAGRLWATLILLQEIGGGERGGISHTPGECSSPRACAEGATPLANAVLRLANED